MRILQVNKLYLPTIGGVETAVQQIAEGLNDKTDMKILVCRDKGEAVDEIYNGIRVIRAKSHGIVMSMPISFDFFSKFRVLSRDCDVLQLHAPFPLADLALLLFKTKAKVVVWWHSDIVRQKLFAKLLSPIIHHTLKRADLIIAATEGNIKSSESLQKFVHKCKTIPFGLNLDKYPIPNDTNFLTSKLKDKSRGKLLFVGRLVYYKGVMVLLNAMLSVTGAELFIVGGGALLSDCVEFISHNKLNDRVHLLGSLTREELLAAFYDCDVFVFPSVANSEAFGLVQLEAMYYGKPVINTNLPTGVPYVSVDGETGITVEVGNVDALSKAIMTLVSDDELRQRYGANAAKRVREKFDRRVMAEKLYEEYEGLL